MCIRDSDPDTQARVLDEWMAYYERLGIERVGFGLITMRLRAGGPPFVRFEDLRHDPGHACGDDIARSFELRDWLDSLGSDDKLLDSRLAVAPDVHLPVSYTHLVVPSLNTTKRKDSLYQSVDELRLYPTSRRSSGEKTGRTSTLPLDSTVTIDADQ